MQASDLELVIAGVLSGDRTWLAKAITLVESTNPVDREKASELLTRIALNTGGSLRIGITGSPGVGKSTFIDEFGTYLTEIGHKVAVLAVDPSSSISGGSILGDKTRMDRLASNPKAFIRPSPSSGVLGGVAKGTRETMLVLEASGFDAILVETVGVGQSEAIVSEMVDFFLVLLLPGSGDSLQGIKKGVLELADLIAVNKADGENELRARQSARDYQSAMVLLSPSNAGWAPPVLTCSGLTGQGVPAIWDQICLHRQHTQETGDWGKRRSRQQIQWMWALVEDRLIHSLKEKPEVAAFILETEDQVLAGGISPHLAAEKIIQLFKQEE
ncbi:MAG: methylmalonyl Co-A mutase-associated GTPase MeaB [Acidimicrobiales bacterium]|jgi:LAO/AO transport system kinase|nr:methylmalonyl Co-A mutase-associated GTPase MeaB [Acidimicrobiales bacterium]MDP6298106.1 methylmalonyl Co-A mutase-associated GTPase MeaB [Acidimicrobiales bacterium]HJM29372.1 methylmalonyl Co-A mutase-associated GTPase MeaB [Acidimicrobiales bacterium]HJM96836.1 methylmalonyl Co-A mutase-associated GTPase MeaB [Acidimicrobiales bacterium]